VETEGEAGDSEMDKRRELMGGPKEGRARGGSMGCIEDLWKRKREEEGGEKEGFVKSRKTLRSPKGGKVDGGGGGKRKKGRRGMAVELERGTRENDEGSSGDVHGEVGRGAEEG